MSNILLLTSSPNGDSGFSTRFAKELAQKLTREGGSITSRDLTAQPLPHIDADYVQGRTLPADQRTPRQAEAVAVAERLIDELNAADAVVIGSAMINFAPSSQLKAWFDHVIWPGVTVRFTAHGAEGLITGKKAYLVTTAGGHYAQGPLAAFDHQAGYLEHLLGFMGLKDIEHVRIEGVAYGPEAVAGAVERASADIERVAAAV